MTTPVNNSCATRLANGFVQAAKSVYKAISSEISVLTFALTNIIKGFQGIGLFSMESSSIKLGLSVIGVVKGTFESIAAIPKAREMDVFRSEFYAQVKDKKSDDSREKRIENLTQACNYISNNEKRVRTSLTIAKTAGLLVRSNDVLAGINSNNIDEQNEALAKGEEFLKTLRRRVNTKFGLALAQVVIKITGLAVSIAFIATAVNPSTLAIAGAVGLATLGLWAYEKIMVPSDPFAAPKDVWYEKAPHKIRMAAYKVSDAVRNFFTFNKSQVLKAVAA